MEQFVHKAQSRATVVIESVFSAISPSPSTGERESKLEREREREKQIILIQGLGGTGEADFLRE